MTIGLIGRLQFDGFAQMLLSRSNIAGLGIDSTEFHASVRIGRCHLDCSLIELDRLGNFLLSVIEPCCAQQCDGILRFGFQGSRVAIERFCIVSLRYKVIALRDESVWSDAQRIGCRVAFAISVLHRRCRDGREGCRDGCFGLGVSRRHRRTHGRNLILYPLACAGHREAREFIG